MARDRSIVVRLRAEVSDFKREMAAAAQSARKVGEEATKSGEGGATVLGRMVKSAQDNRAAWTTAGTALTAFGAAVTGIGVAALKTGIEYNTLQQTTRAALTTLLGSAEAANAQMDKLDDFARTSPFAKQVFITAQQQLIGFGMSAERVVPTLDAVQNAVAGVGGSNQDIAELVNVIAKIGAEGKISAVHLQQFGSRGIEAAELIGQGMGKTGAEIREAITAGTLDADAAVQALVLGMQEKFGGSAENVKNTFEGAVDRVKAAWRDMAAEMARPLVSPDGGGLLIDLANSVADLMQAFRKLPEPVKYAAGAIGGVVGVGSLAAGAFLLLFPRIIETYKAFQTLSVVAPRAAAALRGMGAAAGPIGLVVVAVAGLVAGLEALNKVDFERFSSAEFMSGVIDAAEGIDATAGALDRFFQVTEKGHWNATEGLDGLADALKRVTDKSFTDSFRDLVSFLPGVSNADFKAATEGIEGIDTALAQLVSSGNMDEAAAAWEQIQAEAAEANVPIEKLTELFPEYAAALKDAENQTRLQADATEELADEAKTARDALRKQREALAELTDLLLESANATLGAREADVKYRQALIDSNDKIKENNEVLKKSKEGTEKHTDALISNEEELNNLAGAMLSKIEKEREAGASTVQLREMTEEMRGEFVKSAKQTGRNKAAAEGLADALGLIPGKYNAQIGLTGLNAAMSAIDRFNSKLNFVNGKRVTAAVEAKVYGQAVMADGGFTHGGVVESFASGGVRGGLPKQALIQSPRRNLVQWAEPETGGEAFIPLSPAKRQRSLQIWAETGRRLGAFQSFAGGGFNNAGSAPFSASLSLSDSDVARIAAAVRDGSASGVASGFSGGSSDVARFARMGA